MNPSPHDAPFFAANAALERGDLAQAQSMLREALAADPDHPGGNTLAGLVALRRGDPPRAIAWLERAARLAPDRPLIWLRLGEALQAAGLPADAKAALEKSVALDPLNADAWYDLGFALLRTGGTQAAIEANRTVIRLNPFHSSAYNHVGVALLEQGDRTAAREILTLGAGRASADSARALLARFAGLHVNAAEASQIVAALARDPSSVRSLMNLGLVQSALDDDQTACATLSEVIARASDAAIAHYNLGNVLKNLHRFDEASMHYARALALQPDYPDAELNWGCVSLHQGDYANGWPRFEARLRLPTYADWRRPQSPQWRGESLAGKTLLILCEQGAGDTLQFMRFVPIVAKREGARILIHAPNALRRVLVGLEGVRGVSGPADPFPSHDYHLPMMSLALRLGVSVATLSTYPPLLPVSAAQRTHWSQRIAKLDAQAGGAPRFRVGITWAGNPGQQNDRNRTIPLALLAPLVEAIVQAGGRAYSLQKGTSGSPGVPTPLLADLHDAMVGVDDFADTAAIIEQLDLVVSVCTSVAHVAGSLGKPTWVLLASTADWRWLTERTDSPWYPSVRLFRQSVRGEWPAVIARAATALHPLVETLAAAKENV